MVSESFTSSDADDALPPTAKRRRPTGMAVVVASAPKNHGFLGSLQLGLLVS